MSESRPPLKLKLTTSQRPPPDVPGISSTSTPKLKLKLKPPGKSQTQNVLTNPAPAPKPKAPRKTQAGKPARASKPTPKKRALEASTLSEDDDELIEDEVPPMKKRTTIKLVSKSAKAAVVAPLAGPVASSSGPNKIRLNVNRTKGGKLRAHKPLGEGYDSCASDAESDPAIEEDFILRMQPGDDCEYLKQAIAEQRFGPKSQGGADVRMIMLTQDGRRACVSIRGTLYAAAMVDLPCIVEGMKSWDKKAWYKSVDICQMLLVLGKIKSEDEALRFKLPREVDAETMQYAHGLTAPMHHVRKRRFRKRISKTAIERVEHQVDELLRRDAKAESTDCVILDQNRLTLERNERSQSDATPEAVGNGEQDAEGVEDDGGEYDENPEPDSEDDAAMIEAFESELAKDDDGEVDLSIPDSSALTPALPGPSDTGISALSPASVTAETPAATTPSKGATSGDDEEESDADADSDGEMDEEALAEQQQVKERREEIAELEESIQSVQSEHARTSNSIFKRKLMQKIQQYQQEMAAKKAALGEGEEE